MPDIGAGKTTLGIGDGGSPESFTTIGELRDPLPAVSFERAVLDNTTAADDTEKTRGGMKKVAPMTFKIQAENANAVIAQLADANDTSAIINWEYIYPIAGGLEKVVFPAWVSKFDITPALTGYTMITITLNPNAGTRSNVVS